MSKASSGSTPKRPDYMVKLGLLPPYSLDDVRAAYRDKVKAAHPDRGGTPEAFDQLERAYQQALQHVRFRSDRRGWISAHIDDYVAQQNTVLALMKLGAEVEVEGVDWVKRSLGDFAALTEQISTVRLNNGDQVGLLIDCLVQDHANLGSLKVLDLSGSSVTDELVFDLRVLRSLAVLDLSHTQITARALGIVNWLPALQHLGTSGTSVGWWAGRKLKKQLKRRLQQAGAMDAVVHPVNVR